VGFNGISHRAANDITIGILYECGNISIEPDRYPRHGMIEAGVQNPRFVNPDQPVFKCLTALLAAIDGVGKALVDIVVA
jgi:hypothetical protein